MRTARVALGWLAFLVIPLVLAASTKGRVIRPDDPPPSQNAKARMEAARKTYEYNWNKLRGTESQDVEQVHRWSRRWAEAQQHVSNKKPDQTAAVEAHLDRMKTLEMTVKAQLDAGVKFTVADVSAVEFYRLEAEDWARRIKGK